MEKNFDFNGSLNFSAIVVWRNLWFFLALVAIWIACQYAPGLLAGVIERHIEPAALLISLQMGIALFDISFSSLLNIGLTIVALSFVDNKKPSLWSLFKGWNYVWQYIGASIMYIVIVSVGTLLLLVPGVIWAVKYSLYPYFIVDKGLGPVKALKASAQATSGVKWRLLGFYAMLSLFLLAGSMIIIGILPAYAIMIVAWALVYRQLAAGLELEL